MEIKRETFPTILFHWIWKEIKFFFVWEQLTSQSGRLQSQLLSEKKIYFQIEWNIIVGQFLFRFRSEWSSIWFQIENKTVTTFIFRSIWKEIKTYCFWMCWLEARVKYQILIVATLLGLIWLQMECTLGSNRSEKWNCNLNLLWFNKILIPLCAVLIDWTEFLEYSQTFHIAIWTQMKFLLGPKQSGKFVIAIQTWPKFGL